MGAAQNAEQDQASHVTQQLLCLWLATCPYRPFIDYCQGPHGGPV